jgi:alkylation response protein AidB-like acyl-CoA dehydrogenase
MNVARSDEQRLLAESLRKFLQTENEFEQRRKNLNGASPNRMALWPGLVEMGLIGSAFDEAHGGFAGDARTLAIVMIELGRALAVEPFLGCAVLAGHILSQQADRAAVESDIGRIIAGDLLAVLGHHAGADPFAQPLTAARAHGDGYALSGTIPCVRHADVAGEFLITARLQDDLAVFRVSREALQIEPYRLMDGSAAADLHLQDLQLASASRLMFAVPAQAAVNDALERALFGLAAETVGIVEAANKATFEYLTTRKQFGVPLASFQALQHRAADMQIAAQELGTLLGLAIEGLERAPGAQRSALLAALKSVADTAGCRVGHEAVQLHGGMGVSDELNISHYARRLAAIRAELGSADIHRSRFGTGVELGSLLELQETGAAREWREAVGAFTRKHLPERIALKGEHGFKIEKEDFVRA